MRVIDVPGHAPDESPNISNSALTKVLEGIGIEFLLTVPESAYEVLLKDVANSQSMRLLQVCRESEGMSIASGLTYGGKKTAMICSFKGLYNSVDSLLGTAVRTQASFLLLLSEGAAQAKRMAADLEEGLFTADILKAIKIPYYEVMSDAELPVIIEAWEQTKTSNKPVVVILRW